MVTLSEKSLWVKSHNALCTMTNYFLGNVEDNNHLHSLRTTDICTFARRFLLWGPLTAVFYGIYYFFLIGIFFLIFKGMGFTLGATSIIITILFIIAAICAIIGAVLLIGYFLKDRHTSKEPGIVKTWYSSVKEKTCSFVGIVE